MPIPSETLPSLVSKARSSATTSLYLKPNVYIEPMVNQWYAWPMLIAPHTAAMVTRNLHLKIMESYVKSPKLHANALKNPKMLGGPFIDLPAGRVDLVASLLAATKDRLSDLCAFADAVRTLDDLLAREAQGHSLVPLYEKIPAPLRGYVELGYDLNNQASIRFFERMLYKSPYYHQENQGIALSITRRDERPFVLSTPRFPGPETLHYAMPFASEAIDRLAAMRHTPAPLAQLEAWLPEDREQRAFFSSLFTEAEPQRRGKNRDDLGDGLRIKYFGHAVLLFETKDVTVMTDSLVSYDVGDQLTPRYCFEDLPDRIDYVLLTHGHQDHVMFETLLQLRHRIGTIVVPRSGAGSLQDPNLKLVLEHTGFDNVIELAEMEPLEVPGGRIHGLPFLGEHGDLHIHAKLGYHLDLAGRTVVCAADSNNLSPEIFKLVRQHLGPVDTMFLGMECEGAPLSWLYGPLLTRTLERKMDQSRRFDGSDARKGLEMVEALECNRVFVYAMGQEPWLTFISSLRYTKESKPIVESDQLVAACRARGIESERLYGKKLIQL